MTVALAYRDIDSSGCKRAWIAADSCASDAINYHLVKNAKVFNPVGRSDVLIGCAGTFRLPNLLQYVPGIFPPESELATDDINMSYLINEFTPVVKALIEDFEDDDVWELLLAVGDRIYRMQMDLSIIEPADNCDSIGIGGPVALGAFKVLNELEPEMPVIARMKHALKVACASCQGCAPPFTVMHTKEIDKEVLKNIPKDRESRGYQVIRHRDEDATEEIVITEVSDEKKEKKKNRRKRNKHK